MNDEQFDTIREILSMLYIQVSRQYDMLSIIADKLGADAVGLTQEHEQGKLLSPDPWLSDE